MAHVLKRVAGKLLNILGAPGFIRSNACHSRVGVPVQISVDDMFTVVAVKNVRLLFHRLSGKFDGVVVAAHDCGGDLDSAPSSGDA